MTSNTTPTELAACPFCGRPGRLETGKASAWVECTGAGCDAHQMHYTAEAATAAWNQRASLTPATDERDKRIAELEVALERLTLVCGDYGHMTFAEILAEAAKHPGDRIEAEIAARKALGHG